MNGICRLTVGSSLHCFVQVVYGCAKDIVKDCCCKVIFSLTVQNACPRGKAQGCWCWCRGDLAKVHLMLHLTIFTRSLGPPGLWNTPNIPRTRIFTKPWQMVLQPKLFQQFFSSFVIKHIQPQCRNEPHVWGHLLKSHPKGRSGPYVIWRTSASWRKESSCLALQPCQLFLEQLSITQPGSHTGHRPLLVLRKR